MIRTPLLTDHARRLSRVERALRAGPVRFADLRRTLGASPATIKRDLQVLRGRYGAVIVYDRSSGYRLAQPWGGLSAAILRELVSA
jgi:biotin operon repressor